MKLEFEVEMSKELMNEGNKHDHWAELYRRNQSRKHRLISIKRKMDKEYSIEELIKTFEEHHKNWVSTQEKMLSDHIKNYPNYPLPDHFLNAFSISQALHSICKEINSLHEKIINLQIELDQK